MNFIRIEQQDGELIFERLKRAEILFVNSDFGKTEIYVNIESDTQTEAERKDISERFNTKLSDFIDFAMPRLQLMDIENDKLDSFLSTTIEIEKGWADDFRMSGIYVGWGIQTFQNKIEFNKIDADTFHLSWVCFTDDLNYYDQRAKRSRAQIKAELNALRFSTKKDYWTYEKEKMDRKR